MRIGVKPGQWGWSFAQLRDAWRAAEGLGFDHISCFDHVTAAPAGRAAWDAPSLLSAMATHASRALLAVHVINTSLRNPLLLAGALAVAQAHSGGRLEVGLGAGSYHLARFDHRVSGVRFPRYAERIRRLQACARMLPALWRGESVTDATLHLKDAALGPIDITPPRLVIGGASAAAIDIAARFGDGWDPSEADPAVYARLARALDEAAGRAGRKVDRQVQVFAERVPEGSLRPLLGRFEELGLRSVTFVLVDRRGAEGVTWLAERVL